MKPLRDRHKSSSDHCCHASGEVAANETHVEDEFALLEDGLQLAQEVRPGHDGATLGDIEMVVIGGATADRPQSWTEAKTE